MLEERQKKWYENKQLVQLGIFILALIAAALISYFFNFQKTETAAESEEKKEEKNIEIQICEHRRLLDNVCVEKEQTNLTPWAVMIENHYDSRPPAGLDQASIVFEAIAEASITRFLAIFPGDAQAEKIGPIRSARPYYLDWAAEFDPVYAHVGGSPQALAELAVSSMKDLNQFSNGPYFWRSKNRFAPHNVFTSGELINQAVDDKNWSETSDFDTWIFKPEAKEENRPSERKVKISYSDYYYNTEWHYRPKDNNYIRFQIGKEYKTEAGHQITVKNLAVVYTNISTVDDYGRLRTKTIGSGKAMVFQDGQSIQAEWKKENAKSRLRFYDQNGSEIKMNQGKTWISIVPNHFPQAEY